MTDNDDSLGFSYLVLPASSVAADEAMMARANEGKLSNDKFERLLMTFMWGGKSRGKRGAAATERTANSLFTYPL